MARVLSIIPKQEIMAIQIELTVGEAQTLEAVLANISGPPRGSRRELVDTILTMLQNSTLPKVAHDDITGSIGFIRRGG